MKKLLATVVAAALLLTSCVTAMAASTETISDKSYTVGAYLITDDGVEGDSIAYDTDVNSLTVEYDYETMEEVTTGRYSEDAKMILILVSGFDTSKLTGDISVTIDGKDYDPDDLVGASYQSEMGYFEDDGILKFPVEATKSGYTDTYVIEVESEDADGNTVTETAKITLRMVNESEYKNGETTTISRIAGSGVDAYIVGSKIYLDYASSAPTDDATMEITFRDEDGELFDVVTWAYDPSSDLGTEESIFQVCDEDGTVQEDGEKLDSSIAYFKILGSTYGSNDDALSNVVFKLETSSAIYETKEYDVVIRTDVYETDPKGIYFEEASITLDIGESYTPNVLGVATGRTVDAVIEPGEGTSLNVIDIEDDDTIIGTQEGTAYVTATYEFTSSNNKTTKYESSSMKVTVTSDIYEGETDDEGETSTYMVTASTLNVRTGPSTSYSKASYQLENGELVEVVSIANGWAQLTDGNYVSAQYLMAVTTSEDGSATTMYVTCRTLNVRTGPSTSYSKVGTLSRGTAVQVVATYGDWARLSNGYYVSMSYLSA
ncbi:MAG: SH3 domain-containing protein [Candidatus Spyradocola sp.]|jgi:uncharacterized protein YgiM (DUF1202 family)